MYKISIHSSLIFIPGPLTLAKSLWEAGTEKLRLLLQQEIYEPIHLWLSIVQWSWSKALCLTVHCSFPDLWKDHISIPGWVMLFQSPVSVWVLRFISCLPCFVSNLPIFPYFTKFSMTSPYCKRFLSEPISQQSWQRLIWSFAIILHKTHFLHWENWAQSNVLLLESEVSTSHFKLLNQFCESW